MEKLLVGWAYRIWEAWEREFSVIQSSQQVSVRGTDICPPVRPSLYVNTVNKVNRIIGLIKWKFTYMDKDLFLTLYKSLVRSHLDYGNLVFYPTTKKYEHILENAQRRATRIVPGLRGLTYKERLIELNLPTLD